jgi:hypothetical protein
MAVVLYDATAVEITHKPVTADKIAIARRTAFALCVRIKYPARINSPTPTAYVSDNNSVFITSSPKYTP